MSYLSIVVPCYNEEGSLQAMFGALEALDLPIGREYVFVDDGSADNTLKIIKSLGVKYVSFSRNFGKEAAVYAGLSAASGDYVVLIDADLQQDPGLIPMMLRTVMSGDYDCAGVFRMDRKGEPKVKAWFSDRFYGVFRSVSGVDIPAGAYDYRLMTKQYRDAVLSVKDRARFSKGIFPWAGFKTCWIGQPNRPRESGQSHWSFKKLMDYALDGIFSFSDAPAKLGIGSAAFGSLFMLLSVILVLAGCMKAGIACIAFGAALLSLCFLVVIKYLLYIWDEMRDRPMYIVKESNLQGCVLEKTDV